MGLIGALLTLPLAPVRGTVWLAERVEEQAEDELYDESAIRTGLIELEAMRESGEVDEADIEAAESALLERLMVIRGIGGGGTDGEFE
ncbi:MAG TPA: gas vesicle protein GvpG [Thermoleophilaceae bacterium]|nr:gas vesicle protein GvpG [Thermoleophilaceae bacterium]